MGFKYEESLITVNQMKRSIREALQQQKKSIIEKLKDVLTVKKLVYTLEDAMDAIHEIGKRLTDIIKELEDGK